MDDNIKRIVSRCLLTKTVQETVDFMAEKISPKLSFEAVDNIRRRMVRNGKLAKIARQRAIIEDEQEEEEATDKPPRTRTGVAFGYGAAKLCSAAMVQRIGKLYAEAAQRQGCSLEMAAFKMNYSPEIVRRCAAQRIPAPRLPPAFFGLS